MDWKTVSYSFKNLVLNNVSVILSELLLLYCQHPHLFFMKWLLGYGSVQAHGKPYLGEIQLKMKGSSARVCQFSGGAHSVVIGIGLFWKNLPHLQHGMWGKEKQDAQEECSSVYRVCFTVIQICWSLYCNKRHRAKKPLARLPRIPLQASWGSKSSKFTYFWSLGK